MSVRAIIPVNRLDRSKGRLAEFLSPLEREGLTLATVRTVLAAASEAGLDPVVLSADSRLATLLEPPVTIVPEDPSIEGLNAQLEALLQALRAPALLILHADLPLASARAIRAVVAAGSDASSAVLVESPDGGTNAMLLRPPGKFALAYGPGSFARHRDAAIAAGLDVTVVESPELALDLDTPADLRALLRSEAGRRSAAGAFLLASGIERRLG